MTTQECANHRTEILRHFEHNGSPLSPQAKAHYAGCPDCIRAVTELFTRKITPPANGTPLSDGARRALEHGRQVLEREFGIPSSGANSAT